MEAKFKIDDAIKFTNTVENKYTLGDEGRIDEDGVFERNGNFFYNVKSAGILITDISEDDMNFVYSSVEKNVDSYLRMRDEKKSFKDSDVRVSGSRKEMMAYKGMINSEDLENIEKDKVIAKKLIKKDKVYPEINTNEQIDKGVTGGTLFLKMKVRDFVHSLPPDTAEFRALYVGLCQWLYELFNDAITLDDFKWKRKFFINGIIRKAILIANPEMEDELILQNNEYEQEILKFSEYRDNYYKIDEKINELAKKADISVWDGTKKEEAFPELYKELKYWGNLKRISDHFADNKILPLEYRFLHNLALVDKDGNKTSVLTGQDLPQGVIGESKNIDNEYVVNYSGEVRNALIKSVFGDKFYMFIKKSYRTGKESTYTVYEDAKKYEPFTHEEYDRIYNSLIRPIEEDIEKYSTHLSFLNDSSKTYKERVNYALVETDIGGWFWTRNKSLNFRKMVERGKIDDAINLMTSIISKPDSGYHMKIQENEKRLEELKKKYFVRENNYSFLDKEQKERKKGERTELIVNSGTPLSYIKRTGGIAVYDTDLDSNDKVLSFYKNILGITRITYGLSLPNEERKAHAKHYAQSVIDLAETLNWDVKSLMNLGNLSLGIMFAAAGKGRAMAHYSPDTNAINLTRSKGDGSVCHEIGHGLDHALAEKFPNNRKSEDRHSIYGSFTKEEAQNIGNQKIMASMNNLMGFIKNGVYITKTNEFDESKISKSHHIAEQLLPMLPEFVASVMSSFVSVKIEKNNRTLSIQKYETIEGYTEHLKNNLPQYLNYNYYLANKTKVVDTLGAVLNHLNMDSYDFQLSNKPYNYNPLSNRSQTAFILKNKAMKSKYWSYDWEIFTRGMEAYVFDKMAKSGRSNNYLVSDDKFDRPEGVYPYGIERSIFYILYDDLFNTIKQEINIPDFKPFRDERVDEYIELGENDEEENSLVIDEQTKEIVDSDEDLIKQKEIGVQKMIKLLELLSAKSNENFEYGGQINIHENKLVENLFSFHK